MAKYKQSFEIERIIGKLGEYIWFTYPIAWVVECHYATLMFNWILKKSAIILTSY